MGESGRVCKVCENTDFALAFDPSRWKPNGPDGKPLKYLDDRTIEHHPSIASLRASALQGCPACLFFMEVLKQPLRLQEPEPWGRDEAIESKKRNKAAKRRFDAARRRKEKLVISAIRDCHSRQDFAPPHGAVSGFEYGPRNSWASTRVGVIGSDSSPKSIGPRNLLNHTDTGLCREWLKQCQSEHHDCPPFSECNLPTRLIDVGEPRNYAQPRLVETRGQRGEYVTLSHCWGRSKPPSTTKANLSSRLSSMPLGSMPKTFRDAVNIVRELGYRYIWIDSYCIVQDDDTDWQRECASMAAIYSNCVVTLAAPFASDCHAGFSRGLHPFPAERWCDIPVHWPGTTNPDQLRVVHPYKEDYGRVGWDESPLAERAWVLQEHVLSPRWLYFGKDNLYFECHTARFHEHLSGPIMLSKMDIFSYTSKDVLSFSTHGDGLSRWYRMIGKYSNMCLTYGSDRLPALSGIASRFATKLGDEYIAGMWRRDLVFGLIFKVADPGSAFRSMNPSSIPGPSWSWYSCDRRVRPLIGSHDRFTVKSSHGTYDRALFNSYKCFGPLIEVISLSATPLGTNSFGAVRDAKLTVMGRLQTVWYSDGHVHSNEDGGVFGELSQDVAGTFEWDRRTKVFMLPIAICGDWVDDWLPRSLWHALALTEVLSEPKTYLRIGYIHELKNERHIAVDPEHPSRWKVWNCLFTPELQQLHLV